MESRYNVCSSCLSTEIVQDRRPGAREEKRGDQERPNSQVCRMESSRTRRRKKAAKKGPEEVKGRNRCDLAKDDDQVQVKVEGKRKEGWPEECKERRGRNPEAAKK